MLLPQVSAVIFASTGKHSSQEKNMLVSILQRNKTLIYTLIGDLFFMGVADTVMKVKPHCDPSAFCRSSNVSGMTQYKSKGLRTQEQVGQVPV